jgi:hypothetical protein
MHIAHCLRCIGHRSILITEVKQEESISGVEDMPAWNVYLF